MTTQSKDQNKTQSKDPNKKSLPIPVAIAAVVLLLFFVVWLSFRNFGPPPLPPEHPSANANRMGKIFQDSGGDWDKVSEADKQWIHQFSGGREAMAWATMKGAKVQH